eukprot:m.282250 g.282250  ORF g.282250 m.282250 type:complete len:366 (-) comp26984_c1_seq4:2657-3754(-)
MLLTLLLLTCVLNAHASEPWPSYGCTHPSPYTAPIPVGVPNRMTIEVDDPNLFNSFRNYFLYLPPGYNGTVALPVVYYFPSFYVDAEEAFNTNKLYWLSGQEGGNYIVVVLNGMNDCNELNCDKGGMPTVSWNSYGAGFNGPSPAGPICDSNRTKWGLYPCYSSCQAVSNNDTCGPCVSASCSNDTKFFETVKDQLNNNFCTDTRRLYVTGMSVGAMMGVKIATLFADVLAGAVLAAPGVMHGWWKPPTHPIPMMDIHGHFDDIIPANVTNSHLWPKFKSPYYPEASFSEDGFYYVPSYNWTRVRSVSRARAVSRRACIKPLLAFVRARRLNRVLRLTRPRPLWRCAVLAYLGHCPNQRLQHDKR